MSKSLSYWGRDSDISDMNLNYSLQKVKKWPNTQKEMKRQETQHIREKWKANNDVMNVWTRERIRLRREGGWAADALRGTGGLDTHWRGCMSEIAQQKAAQRIQINIIIKSLINTKASTARGGWVRRSEAHVCRTCAWNNKLSFNCGYTILRTIRAW